eukprot:1971873-Rhodomonas_salina.2
MLEAEAYKAAAGEIAPKFPMDWEDVCAILLREKATLLFLDVRDSEGKREGRGVELTAWVVSEEGEILVSSPICLRISYALSSTEVAYVPAHLLCYARY